MTQTYIPLLIFLLPLAYSPGPGNLTFALAGARDGFATTLPALLSYHLATFGVTYLFGIGLLTAFQPDSTAFAALQWAGSAYILWLTWRFWHANAHPPGTRPSDRSLTPRDGAVLLLLNPKAYLIITLMFSQFLPRADAEGLSVFAITTTFTLNNAAAFSLWTLCGTAIAKVFDQPQQAKWINRTCAVLLALAALWMLA